MHQPLTLYGIHTDLMVQWRCSSLRFIKGDGTIWTNRLCHSNMKEGDNEMQSQAIAPTKKTLPRSKKEGLMQMLGKYSTKVDLNKVRDAQRNEDN